VNQESWVHLAKMAKMETKEGEDLLGLLDHQDSLEKEESLE